MADSETLRTHGTVHCSDRDAIPRGLSLSQHTLRTCPNAIRAAAPGLLAMNAWAIMILQHRD